jgi:hypothetical protein
MEYTLFQPMLTQLCESFNSPLRLYTKPNIDVLEFSFTLQYKKIESSGTVK